MQASVNILYGGSVLGFLCKGLIPSAGNITLMRQPTGSMEVLQKDLWCDGCLGIGLTYISIFFLISSLILLSCDKICIMKAFIQTSADESYSWPIDNLFLTGGGLFLELVLHSCVLLLDWAALLFHP